MVSRIMKQQYSEEVQCMYQTGLDPTSMRTRSATRL